MNAKSHPKYWTESKLDELTTQYNNKLTILDICKLHMYDNNGVSTKITSGGIIYQLCLLLGVSDSNKHRIRGYTEYRNSDLYKTFYNSKYPNKLITEEFKLNPKQLNEHGLPDYIEEIEILPKEIKDEIINDDIKTMLLNKVNKNKKDKEAKELKDAKAKEKTLKATKPNKVIKLEPININDAELNTDTKLLFKLLDNRTEQYINIISSNHEQQIADINIKHEQQLANISNKNDAYIKELMDIIFTNNSEILKKVDNKFFTYVRIITKLYSILKIKLPDDLIFKNKLQQNSIKDNSYDSD